MMTDRIPKEPVMKASRWEVFSLLHAPGFRGRGPGVRHKLMNAPFALNHTLRRILTFMSTLASPRIDFFRHRLGLACAVWRLLPALPAVAQAQLTWTTNSGTISHKE
jgi:hypothetical protein